MQKNIGWIKFSSMEQYMMYEKALLFQDQEAAEKAGFHTETELQDYAKKIHQEEEKE